MLKLEETLAAELPQSRYLVLELAALLDRLDEAAQREQRSLAGDARLRILDRVLDVLSVAADKANRAERVLRIYCEAEAPTPGA